MKNSSITRNRRISGGLIKLSQRVLAILTFLWAIFILFMIISIVAFFRNLTEAPSIQQYVGWVGGYMSFTLVLIGVIILLSLTIITFIISRLQRTETSLADIDQELKRYLEQVINSCERLALSNIPATLVVHNVSLDDVFVPLHFRLRRPLTDYPLAPKGLHQSYLTTKPLMGPEDFLLRNEKNWSISLKQSRSIGFDGLWQCLTREQPAAVIQGYPGMGKTTLLAYMALHMARYTLGQAKTVYQFASPFIPIFLRLSDYADVLNETPTLSLSDYLKRGWHDIPGLAPLMFTRLQAGRCLILFDGLDAISIPATRHYVQQAIYDFVSRYSNAETTKEGSFNRILITARIAGYERNTFFTFPHYTIAELTIDQIEDFLVRWYRATTLPKNMLTDDVPKEQITIKEAIKDAKKVFMLLKQHPDILSLAGNPFLLTLLVIMRQNGIELPGRRVELYQTIITTLLEHRNKDLPPIRETQAIQRLGPLAYEMQERGNSFAHYESVTAALREAILREDGNPEQVDQEVQSFINQLREREGVFGERVAGSHYFGFAHRTFQEYFAARYLLQEVHRNDTTGIALLVNKARRDDDLWREPFLLAVAYESNSHGKMASKIIHELLSSSNSKDPQRDLLLATESLLEAKPLSIDPELELRLATEILLAYRNAHNEKRFGACERIEAIMAHWLVNVPTSLYPPPILTKLSEVISNRDKQSLQRSTLTLLILIAGQLASGPAILFTVLIPRLSALTGLPSITNYSHDAMSYYRDPTNLTTADLALLALAYLGQLGPSGALLAEFRQDLFEHPKWLTLLAYCSLECRTLLLPTMIPNSEENYQEYETAMGEWIDLRDKQDGSRINERSLTTCTSILLDMLHAAETVYTSRSVLLLDMLLRSDRHPPSSWQEIWQGYLLDQMRLGRYLYYQEAILLWITLFPSGTDLSKLITLLYEQYAQGRRNVRRCAQRFLAFLSNDLRNQRNLRDGFYLRDVRDISYLRDHQTLQEFRDTRLLQKIQKKQDIRTLQNKSCLQYLDGGRDLQALHNLLLTSKVAKVALEHLHANESEEDVDLLTILLGRILQIVEIKKFDKSADDEIKQITDYAQKRIYIGIADEDVFNAALEIFSYLPARTSSEIRFILKVAKDTHNEKIQVACGAALRRTEPRTDDALAELKSAKDSNIETIRLAANLGLRKLASQ